MMKWGKPEPPDKEIERLIFGLFASALVLMVLGWGLLSIILTALGPTK